MQIQLKTNKSLPPLNRKFGLNSIKNILTKPQIRIKINKKHPHEATNSAEKSMENLPFCHTFRLGYSAKISPFVDEKSLITNHKFGLTSTKKSPITNHIFGLTSTKKLPNHKPQIQFKFNENQRYKTSK